MTENPLSFEAVLMIVTGKEYTTTVNFANARTRHLG